MTQIRCQIKHIEISNFEKELVYDLYDLRLRDPNEMVGNQTYFADRSLMAYFNGANTKKHIKKQGFIATSLDPELLQYVQQYPLSLPLYMPKEYL